MSDDNGSPRDAGDDEAPKNDGRFKLGKSGNSRGRPKKPLIGEATTWEPNSLALSEANRVITVQEGGKRIKATAIRLAYRREQLMADLGTSRPEAAAIKRYERIKRQEQQEREEAYKIFLFYQNDERIRLAKHEKARVPYPEVLPHPNDILLDEKTLGIRFIGPFDKHEKERWDCTVEYGAQAREALPTLITDFKKARGRYRAMLAEEIARFEYVIKIADYYPDEKTRRSAFYDPGARMLPLWIWRAKRPDPKTTDAESWRTYRRSLPAVKEPRTLVAP